MTSPYHAYDIRGIYPDEVNIELVEKVIPVLVKSFFGDGKIVVGHDPRIGSDKLYNATIKELINEKREIIEVGLMTTPMLTFLVHDLDAGGGIIITASHNPKEYNGLKVLGRGGEPISGVDIEKKIKND